MRNDAQQVRIRLDNELMKKIETQMELEECSFNNLVERAIKYYLVKDVQDQSMFFAKMESFKDEIRELKTSTELMWFAFSDYIRMYLAENPEVDNLTDEIDRSSRVRHSKWFQKFLREVKEVKPSLWAQIEYALEGNTENNGQ